MATIAIEMPWWKMKLSKKTMIRMMTMKRIIDLDASYL